MASKQAFSRSRNPESVQRKHIPSSNVLRNVRDTSKADYSHETFGMRLSRIRHSRGMTLNQLGEMLGVSKPTVWAWEHGKAHPISSRLSAIAKALDVSNEDLIPDPHMPDVLDEINNARSKIAQAYGVNPEQVRVLIDL